MERLNNLLKDSAHQNVQVGFFETAKYEDGQTVAAVAVQNEYGNTHLRIPPRPFMRPTIKKKRREWQGLIKELAGRVVKNKLTFEQALDVLGAKAAGDCRETITQIQSPPLSPVTIMRRKQKRANKKTTGLLTKPLVDEGIMLNSLTHAVNKK